MKRVRDLYSSDNIAFGRYVIDGTASDDGVPDPDGIVIAGPFPDAPVASHYMTLHAARLKRDMIVVNVLPPPVLS